MPRPELEGQGQIKDLTQDGRIAMELHDDTKMLIRIIDASGMYLAYLTLCIGLSCFIKFSSP